METLSSFVNLLCIVIPVNCCSWGGKMDNLHFSCWYSGLETLPSKTKVQKHMETSRGKFPCTPVREQGITFKSCADLSFPPSFLWRFHLKQAVKQLFFFVCLTCVASVGHPRSSPDLSCWFPPKTLDILTILSCSTGPNSALFVSSSPPPPNLSRSLTHSLGHSQSLFQTSSWSYLNLLSLVTGWLKLICGALRF